MTGPNAIAFQRSGRIVLDTSSDPDGRIENVIRQFAELTSAAGNLHTYDVSELALWAAAASGYSADDLQDLLQANSQMRVPGALSRRVIEFFERFGHLRLVDNDGELVLESDDRLLLRQAASVLQLEVVNDTIPIPYDFRGKAKAQLASAGFPVMDKVRPVVPRNGGYSLSNTVDLRDYQRQAVERFVRHGQGGGVILLPCGAGKTVVGVAVAASLDACVLVVTPNRTIGEQWASHFASMTTLSESDISLFSSQIEDKPVSIMTYQALTAAHSGHLARLQEAVDIPWGLIIYDEVHSLPADVFRQSAVLQSRRKLGLTATLVREDGREREVYALVGPPIWQSRWRDLEQQGWISPVQCFEVRVRTERTGVTEDQGFAAKLRVVERLVERHQKDQVLVAAHRLREVQALSRRLGVPAVTGETPQSERGRLYDAFRHGEVATLVVSRVANIGVDLPDANVLIQVSGTFGSRLEEAQRLGRLLRPTDNAKPARFYSLVLPDTREREFAQRRQRFLVDQGYRYQIVNARS